MNELKKDREPQNFIKFLTYSFSYIALGVGVTSLGPLLPFLSANVGVSIGLISFIFTAQNIGYMIGSVIGGKLYDRIKSHRLMVAALCLMIFMLLLIPLTTWFYLLLFVLFFYGLGLGTLDIGGNLNLLWIFKSKVSPFMNALHFSFGLGGILAPLVISFVFGLTGGSLSWAIWTLILFSLPGLVGLMLQKSPQYAPKAETQTQDKAGNSQLVFLLVLLCFLTAGIQIGFTGWIVTYVIELQIADSITAAMITSMFWGFLTLGRLLTIPISTKVPPGKILLGLCTLSVVVLGLILIWPLQIWMMWLGSAGLGLAISSILPTLLSYAESKMSMTGRVTGLFFLGISLGMMLIPMALGQIFEYFGGFALMLTLFIASFFALLVMIGIYSGRLNRT